MKYQVTVSCNRTEVYEVDAESTEDAEELVLLGNFDVEVETVNSDYEVESTVCISPVVVGDDVVMPEPNSGDEWVFGEFNATVTDIDDGFAIVEDQDSNFWTIQVNRLTPNT